MFKIFHKKAEILDWEIAKELIKNNKEKISWHYDTVTLDWAMELAKYKWHEIQLCLKTLNSNVAKELAKFEWENNFVWPCQLFFEISNWEEDTIDALSEFKWDLVIYWIKLDRKLSKAFSKFHWYRLWFWDLDEINEEVADKLAESKANYLRVGLVGRKINVDIAESLAKFKWEELRLEIKEIDESIAEELAKFKWKHLMIDWIKELNEGIARWLAKFNWDFLHLNGSTMLSVYALGELKDCKWFKNWVDNYM